MSMISDLVDRLRTESKSMGKYGTDYMATLLMQASDTIVMLSEKARADRPQGEWTCRDLYWHTAICSNCNKVTMFEEWDGEVMEYNYCPNCGAKMKGADDE